MKTKTSPNPFKRRKIEVGEFIITELPLYKFLDCLEALLDNDIVEFSLLSGLPLELIKEETIIQFLELHRSNENKEKEGESKLLGFSEIAKTTWKLCVFLGEFFGSDPLTLSREYTLNQLILCINECVKEPEKRAEGKVGCFKDKPVPPNARNYKEWIDKAGNRCRSWEVEI